MCYWSERKCRYDLHQGLLPVHARLLWWTKTMDHLPWAMRMPAQWSR